MSTGWVPRFCAQEASGAETTVMVGVLFKGVQAALAPADLASIFSKPADLHPILNPNRLMKSLRTEMLAEDDKSENTESTVSYRDEVDDCDRPSSSEDHGITAAAQWQL